MKRVQYFLLASLLPVLTIIIWHSVAEKTGSYLLPSPAAVLATLKSLAVSGQLTRHLGISSLRVAEGFCITAVAAVCLGAALGLSPILHALFSRWLDFWRQVPPLALLPMLILWFGLGELSKLAIVILATFFPVFLATYDAVSRPDKELLELGTLYGFSPRENLLRLRLPMALPEVFTGLRIGLGYSWRSLIGAEMFAASSGLGYLIIDGEEMARPDMVLAGIIAIGIAGSCADALMWFLSRQIRVLRPTSAMQNLTGGQSWRK